MRINENREIASIERNFLIQRKSNQINQHQNLLKPERITTDFLVEIN